MKNVLGWWMPDYDTHFEKHMFEGEYQKFSRDITLGYVKDFNTVAIDVGANIGFWTKPLSKKFNHVHAFEPLADNRECLVKNITSENYTLYYVALGKENLRDQPIYINQESCGAPSLDSTKASTSSDIVTDVTPLDGYNLTNVGYMKIDVQGTEKEVILGSLETLKNNDVCLVVELPKRNTEEKQYHSEVTKLLSTIGYTWQEQQYKKEAVFLKC